MKVSKTCHIDNTLCNDLEIVFWWDSNPRPQKSEGLQISGLLLNNSITETLLFHWQIHLHMA